MTIQQFIPDIELRIGRADVRYGDFASTHEALGVALEEWNELQEAVCSNNQQSIEYECLDLAAVLIRFAGLLRASQYSHKRSQKSSALSGGTDR